jgi:hypothetical protein
MLEKWIAILTTEYFQGIRDLAGDRVKGLIFEVYASY